MEKLIVLLLLCIFPCLLKATVKEKTFVVWVSNISDNSQGGSAISLERNDGRFDAVVFGELSSGKWMVGSENYNRTQKDLKNYPNEKAVKNELVQIAVTYSSEKISLYRNGILISSYKPGAELVNFDEEAVILFGLRHTMQNDIACLNGEIEDARIYDVVLSQEDIKALVPDKIIDLKPWAWWNFETDENENTGRIRYSKLSEGAFVRRGALVLTSDKSVMYASNEPDFTLHSQRSLIDASWSTHLLRDSLLKDKHRPAYHFVIPEGKGSPFDPNGAFYYKGRYHLMYLYDRRENGGFAWGHVSSKDLLHWRFHPDALAKGDGDEGIFSGGAYVDESGKATLSYWMLWGDKGIGLAQNNDQDFNTWTKIPQNPVIKSTEWGITDTVDQSGNRLIYGSADPSNIWKKGNKYYMLTGNLLVLEKYGRKDDSPRNMQGDHLYLFESNDMTHWKYLHEFYQSDRKWTDKSEDNMCPSFLPLPISPEGGKFSGKHLLLSISHNLGCRYYIGTYNNDRFYPDLHERMTWVDNAFFAPEALVDDQGRQIMWSWIFDKRPDAMKEASGWDGMYSLPRTLWLREDGTLGIKPVQELETLRYNPYKQDRLSIQSDMEVLLNHPERELMELKITFAPGKAEVLGVKVCCSEDGREETLIYYDRQDKKLKMDVTQSSIAFGLNNVESAPFELSDKEPLELQIFIDKGLIEVFANDKQAIARPVYPMLGGKQVKVFSKGAAAEVVSSTSWAISPSNPY